jgi:heme-degrading monooxygenase HmoA
MTTIGMHYDVLPGKEAEFERGFTAVAEKLKGVAGHVESRLFHDVHQAGSYLIFSQWNSQADFQAFIKSDAFRAVTIWGTADILRGRPRHTVYENQ